MLNVIKYIIRSNKEVISIAIFIPTALIVMTSSLFLSIVISTILAYFLYNIKRLIMLLGCSAQASFVITYSSFISIFSLMLFLIIPIIFKQFLNLFNDLPFMIQKIKFLSYRFIIQYPIISSSEQTNLLFLNVISYVQSIGKTLVSASLLSITIIIKSILCLFLTPILTFFFLKDYIKMVNWFKKIMPEKTEVCIKIWYRIYRSINNYIRGKFIEMIIITFINYFLFKAYKIAYFDLLAFIVGVSVIIPYIGSIIVSIPVILISAIQLGISQDFFNLSMIYISIQFLDGNLLVPVLFSEAVSLHPVAIIVAIIVFGSTLSLYGVVFAIPLAVVAKAIIDLYLISNKS